MGKLILPTRRGLITGGAALAAAAALPSEPAAQALRRPALAVQVGPFGKLPAISKSGLKALFVAGVSRVDGPHQALTQIEDLVNGFDLRNVTGEGAMRVRDPIDGKPLWRFDTTRWMRLQGVVLSSRNLKVVALARAHRGLTGHLCSMGAQGDTNSNMGGAGTLDWSNSSSIATYLRSCGTSASTDATNKSKIIMGSQWQALGVRTSAVTNSTRLYINDEFATVGNPLSKTTVAGVSDYVELARYAYAPGSSGNWAAMDVRAFAVYDAQGSTDEIDADMRALMAHYGILRSVNELVIDGDSIEQGFTGKSYENPCMFMHVPPATRLYNAAHAGDVVADLVTRRDAANSIHAAGGTGNKLSGSSRLVVQVGINDILNLGRTAANVYNEASVTNSIVSYLGAASVGALKSGRYDKAVMLSNIACGNATGYTGVQALRPLLEDLTTFRSDVGVTSAQLTTIPIYLLQHNGATPFNSSSEFTAATAYQIGDSLHPSGFGYSVLGPGGSTPQYSFDAAFTA
jgi:hypothetical protein